MKLILLIICCFLSSSVWAKITAEFKPNPMNQGGTTELILTSNQPFNGVPNLDVLKQDFVIGGQQQRQSSRWVNGKSSALYQMSFTLFPNKSGDIRVTGFKVGEEDIVMPVLTVGKNKAYETQGKVLLEVSCPQASLYPAQKLLCSVWLEDSMGLVDGQIVPPNMPEGVWEQVLPPMPVAGGKGTAQRYQSAFSFTPKQSGLIKIPPFIFQGAARLRTQQNRSFNSIFDIMTGSLPSTATQPVGAQSAPFSLKIKEKPANYTGWWLPSSQVTLTETFDAPKSIAIGEPISRTFILRAKDVLAEDMPVVQVPQTQGLKSYANPEKRLNLNDGGQVEVTVTFVPTVAGELLLPEVKVPWFNTATEQIQEATLPPQSIVVQGGAEAVSDSLPQTKQVISQPQPEPSEKSKPQLVQKPITQAPASVAWRWVALFGLGAFLFGILIAFLVFRHFSKKQAKAQLSSKKKKPLPDLYPF